MIDEAAAQLALRNRALSLVVATTGSTALSATATGYARAAGSFVTDGFVVGMEVQPSAFGVSGNNDPKVITGVSALALDVDGGASVESAAGGRSLVAGLPACRGWENMQFEPINGRPYITEEFICQPGQLRSFPAQGAIAEEIGLYIIKWYGLSNTDVLAIRKSVGALKALFAPGTALPVGGTVVRVREGLGNAPYTGQLIPQDGGWSVVTLTVPWRAYTTNVVAP